jgi:hypothetical protein
LAVGYLSDLLQFHHNPLISSRAKRLEYNKDKNGQNGDAAANPDFLSFNLDASVWRAFEFHFDFVG